VNTIDDKKAKTAPYEGETISGLVKVVDSSLDDTDKLICVLIQLMGT
jgi:hypothetical protein